MGESVILGACARTVAGITFLPITVVKTRFEVCFSSVWGIKCVDERSKNFMRFC